jgi:DNA helicase-2/ATP-dependent DNA helicase PcrA
MVVEESGYWHSLEEEGTLKARTKMENVEELKTAIREFEEQSERKTLETFLENVTLLTDQDTLAESADAVPLMTLHSAKGLEFPVVFMVGMEQGLFPLARALESDNPVELEEERRLCYVGMTRAERRLLLTFANIRTLFGRTVRNRPSQFLASLPDEVLAGEAEVHPPREITWSRAQARVAPEAAEILARAKDGPFKAGDRVRHEQFGIGVVVEMRGEGADMVVTVAFPKQGVKKLALEYARLERA